MLYSVPKSYAAGTERAVGQPRAPLPAPCMRSGRFPEPGGVRWRPRCRPWPCSWAAAARRSPAASRYGGCKGRAAGEERQRKRGRADGAAVSPPLPCCCCCFPLSPPRRRRSPPRWSRPGPLVALGEGPGGLWAKGPG